MGGLLGAINSGMNNSYPQNYPNQNMYGNNPNQMNYNSNQMGSYPGQMGGYGNQAQSGYGNQGPINPFDILKKPYWFATN